MILNLHIDNLMFVCVRLDWYAAWIKQNNPPVTRTIGAKLIQLQIKWIVFDHLYNQFFTNFTTRT